VVLGLNSGKTAPKQPKKGGFGPKKGGFTAV
jgi:hypothetical protein